MPLKLVGSSVVIVAQHFNPSVAGQHWLITHDIVLPGEIQVGAIFTDMFVQVPTRDFNLLLVPENCQFEVRPEIAPGEQRPLIEQRLGKLISLLPHTPYMGVGLNFVWQFHPDNETIEETCRRCFFLENKPFHRQFDVGGAHFGAYMSKDWQGFRVQLNAKPLIVALPDGQQNKLVRFNFNYHFGLAGRPEPCTDILNVFKEWDTAYSNASSIVQAVAEEKQS